MDQGAATIRELLIRRLGGGAGELIRRRTYQAQPDHAHSEQVAKCYPADSTNSFARVVHFVHFFIRSTTIVIRGDCRCVMRNLRGMLRPLCTCTVPRRIRR